MIRVSADQWYRVSPKTDGITLIDEPHILPFYRCNIWHVRGRDGDLLMDSGMGVVSLRAHVPLVSGRPLQAVASHTHFDHIGCHYEFDCRLCHAAEAGLLAHPTRANTLADPYVTDEIFTALPPQPYLSTSYTVQPAPATRLLQDDDIVDLGDRHWQVIHTPGHSPGGIALWEAATATLISGDILYDGPLIEDAYHSDPAAYVASMRRLRGLCPRVVHGGHFPSFDGARFATLIDGWLRAKGL